MKNLAKYDNIKRLMKHDRLLPMVEAIYNYFLSTDSAPTFKVSITDAKFPLTTQYHS